MKFDILLQFAFVLTGLVGLSNVIHPSDAHAAVQVRTVDWASLQSSCESNLGRYLTKLSDAHDAIADEINSMTKTQYEDAFDARDPKVMLAIATWPSITKEKDEFWKANLTCSNLHRSARNALMQGQVSSVEQKRKQKEAVEAFVDCVETKITRGAEIAPLSGLVRCYAGHIGAEPLQPTHP